MRKITMKRTIFLFLIFLTISPLRANLILVKDADEIKAQLSTIQPGDTLLMKTGIWKDQHIVINGNGTQTAPIVLKAEVPGKVWITGRSNLRIGGEYVVVDGLYFTNGYSPDGAVIEFRDDSHRWANHCRLTNSAIVDFNPSSKSTDYKWVSLYGQHNRVDHCYFAGKNHSGTTLVVWLSTTPNYHQIDHNYFGHRPDLGYNGGETIRVGTSDYSMYDSYTTVEWNYFERCDGEIEIISNKSCKNTYRYNTFESCKGTLTLRHGNACEVYGNFFFGHNVDRSGGVRIIGEDHRVYNNYFQDLSGTDLRAAISMMNGVPNSPLNRYFQVKRAQVLFNTIVHCYEPLVIGAGADDEKTLPPKDCIIANNAILSTYNHELVTFEAQPINMTWAGNIFYGPDPGFENIPGISIQDPLLQLAADSLYRPASNSPLIDAAVDSFAFVTDDMDGQSRNSNPDIGADEVSNDPVFVHPLTSTDVGPDWFPPEPPPQPVIRVQAGLDSLYDALQRADDGYAIELVTDNGLYEMSRPLIISKNITIRSAKGLAQLPRIVPAASVDSLTYLFSWGSSKRLELQNLKIDGSNKVRYLFENNIQKAQLRCDSLLIENIGLDQNSAVFHAEAGSLVDSLLFYNTSFFHAAGHGILANEEAEDSGVYNVNNLVMENCTVWDYPQSFLEVYAGDDIPFTLGPNISINHCTFYQVGQNDTTIINAREVDFTWIKNSIFARGPQGQPSVRIYGPTAMVNYCDFYEAELPELNRSAKMGTNIWQLDPQFIQADQGNFGLAETSYFWGKADDDYPLGDLRWTGYVMGIEEMNPSTMNVQNYLLVGNFPNPFNGQTNIQIIPAESGELKWAITDVQGRIIDKGHFPVSTGQKVRWNWNANQFATGLYFLKVRLHNHFVVKKLLLMR